MRRLGRKGSLKSEKESRRVAVGLEHPAHRGTACA
jgi:hypothetical protein